MPNVDSADQATDIAVGFLKEHYQISQRPLSAKLEQGKWVVEVDVGRFLTAVAKVTINSDTGTIMEYQVLPPQRPASLT